MWELMQAQIEWCMPTFELLFTSSLGCILYEQMERHTEC